METHTPPIIPAEFRKALGKFASGVTVITTSLDGHIRGMTVSAFFSLSMNPPLVAVAVHKQSKLHALLDRANHFGVSILASHQAHLSDHFAGRNNGGTGFEFVELDCVPVIQDALVHLCCSVMARYEGGDHTIFTGLVKAIQYREDCEALVCFSGNYGAFDKAPNNGESGKERQASPRESVNVQVRR